MRRKSMTVLGAALLALGCAGCAARAVPFEQGSDRYTFDIALKQAAGEGEAFRCAATVKDLKAGGTITAPAIVGRAGTPARTTAEDAVTGARLEVELVVDDAARLATCSAVVKKGAALIASDAAKLPLR